MEQDEILKAERQKRQEEIAREEEEMKKKVEEAQAQYENELNEILLLKDKNAKARAFYFLLFLLKQGFFFFDFEETLIGKGRDYQLNSNKAINSIIQFVIYL